MRTPRFDPDAVTARIPAQRSRAPITKPLPVAPVLSREARALRERWRRLTPVQRRDVQRVCVVLERYCEGKASAAAVAVALGFPPLYLTPALESLREQATPWLAWSARGCPCDRRAELCAPCGDVIRAWWNLRDPLAFEIMRRRGGR